MQVLHVALFLVGNILAARFSGYHYFSGEIGEIDLTCEPKNFVLDFGNKFADLLIDQQDGVLSIEKSRSFKIYAWNSGQLALVLEGSVIPEGSWILLTTQNLPTAPCNWNDLVNWLMASGTTFATSRLIGSSITCQEIQESLPRAQSCDLPGT